MIYFVRAFFFKVARQVGLSKENRPAEKERKDKARKKKSVKGKCSHSVATRYIIKNAVRKN